MNRQYEKLKVLFVTSHDPFFGRHFFAEFFRRYDREKAEILGVIVQEPLGTSKTGAFKKAFALYGLIGTFKLSLNVGLSLIFGTISRVLFKGKGNDYTLPQVLAREHIPIIEMGNINDAESIDTLKGLAPDIIVSMSASQKFGGDVLQIPHITCLNVHSGELPRYRGMSTVFWMLYEGKGYTCPTIHVMNERLDDGPIVDNKECDIDDDDTLYAATVKTKLCAARLLAEVISRYYEGDVELKPNDKAEAKLYRFPGREDAREFRKRGRRLI